MIPIKNRLKSLLPEYVVENYPKFVDFLSAYCEWIEQQENPAGYIRNLQNNLDIDLAIDEFVDDFKQEIIPQIPETALSDKRLYLKFVNDIKQTKGSEESFRLLYRLMYNESIDIYYPKNDILRVSDGKWIKDEIYLFLTNKGNPVQLYETATISQTRDIGDGKTENALGLITGVREVSIQGYDYIRVSVTDVIGTFKKEWPVTIAGEYQEFIYPSVDKVNIDAAGSGYLINDLISWPSGQNYEIASSINHNLIADLKVTTSLTKDKLYVEVDGIDIGQDFEFDGRKLYLSNYENGQSVVARLPSLSGYGIVSEIIGSGEISQTKIINYPLGYNVDHTLSIESNNGSGGLVSSNNADYIPVPGRYRNNDGHLSSDKYLWDGNFYQEYSYVIIASRTLESYADVFKKLVHPGGMKMFGEISIVDIVSMTISIEDWYKAIVPIHGPKHNTSLGPVLANIETFKNHYHRTNNNVGSFDDLTSGEIEDYPGKGINLEAPPRIQFLFEGIDVDEAIVASDSLYNIVMFNMPNHVEEYEVLKPTWS